VRELKNVIFKAAIQTKPGMKELRASDLPPAICGMPENAPATLLQGNLDDMEKQMILQALSRVGGSQVKAAEQLGISARTLRRKLVKYKREEQGAGPQDGLGAFSNQQQRYFRAMIEIPVALLVDGREIQATTVNISSGGLAVQSAAVLDHGASVEASFTLPGMSNPIEARMKLAWTAPEGLAGLSIVEIHPALQRELQQWLAEKADAEMPMENEAAE
jgi:transposase-like protein